MKAKARVSRIVDALAAAHQAFKDAAREAHEALKDAEAATARARGGGGGGGGGDGGLGSAPETRPAARAQETSG